MSRRVRPVVPAGAGIRPPEQRWDDLLIPALAGAAVLIAALWAYAAFSVAAGQDQIVVALVVIAAAPGLMVMAVRPQLIPMAMAAALVANAGIVLNEQFGVPSVVRGLVIVGVLIALVRPALRGQLLRGGAVLSALLAYAAVRIVTTAAAPRPIEFGALVQELGYGIAIVALLGLAGIRRDWMRQTIAAAVGAAGLLSAAGLAREYGLLDYAYGFAEYQGATPDLEQIARRSLIPLDTAGRIGGPVAEPNFWAQMLALAAPLALWLAWRHRGRLRLVGVIALPLIIAALLQTSSRGGLIALGVALMVLLVLSGGRTRWLALAIPLALVGAVIVTGGGERFAAVGQLGDVQGAEDEALRGRASENLAALVMLSDHPLTGIGAGNYPTAYPEYAADLGLDSRNTERAAHNSYLEAAAEGGLPGGIMFAVLMAVAVVVPLRARRRLASAGIEEDALLAGAVAAAMAGYATASVFLHQGFPEYTWLALGLSAMVGVAGARAADRVGGTAS